MYVYTYEHTYVCPYIHVGTYVHLGLLCIHISTHQVLQVRTYDVLKLKQELQQPYIHMYIHTQRLQAKWHSTRTNHSRSYLFSSIFKVNERSAYVQSLLECLLTHLLAHPQTRVVGAYQVRE